jgi:murein L,D-transpeptidase YcbB/YkuD
MSHGRGRLAGCVSVAVLGGLLHLATSERVQSQPTAAPPPVPTPSVAQAPVAGLPADQIQLMLQTLEEAPSHGFGPGLFAVDGLRESLASQDPTARLRAEERLKRVLIAYARAQRTGQAPSSAFLDDWTIRPASYDAEKDFDFALSQNRLAPWLATIAPPFERYRALRTALGQYRAIEARGGWAPIPAGPALKPGMTDVRVPALRARLAAENAPGAIELTSEVYDPALVAAVTSAQARYGQPADGVVGPATLAAFNRPVEARIEQIIANMERWRWMPRAWPRTRVEVNIAGAQLNVFEDNVRIDTMRVAVGARATKTPMLMSEIHSVVLNPPWNVPTSIASKELLPKGGDYLARNGFRFVSNGAGGTRLQQKPGPGNSLGRLKFDFDNPFAVYLHDTNSKAVFERDTRSVSHGCIRVERPEDLARIVLGGNADWDAARIDAALQNEDTVRARADKRWPVILAYWTVFTGDNDSVNFRDDIYGWDDALSRMINSGRIAT